MKSRDELICENMGLVYSCAKKLCGRGVEYEELCSAGTVGLIFAVDRFDETRGFKFSTFAVPAILGEMKRIFRDGGTVKVSRSVRELSLKIARFCETYEAENGEMPTVLQISESLSVEAEQVTEALCASQVPKSLTAEEGEDVDISVPSKEESIIEKLTLYQVIDELEEEEKSLIKLRYFMGRTQVETAEKLGLTQVQVSRKEKKILLCLREKMTI
ncbi:MAG: sigma-70 family RNA polymerase sigma factor [Eubacteriales bacterium]|nr:sigma-70 family RNA polymerase sigma factor [Eubacteriales bacterium]